MAQKGVEKHITGCLYTGKAIKITAGIEPMDTLIQMGHLIKDRILREFKKKYGNIIDFLHVPVQTEAITTLAQYWDVSLRCFTFQDFQIMPTIEEYGELLRMPVAQDSAVYQYPGYLPSKNTIAKLLGVGVEEIQIVRPGQTEGISKNYLEAHLKNLADKKAWEAFNRVFALAIYGLIIFPSSQGIVDLHAISVFQMVEYHHVNPIPAMLAETYMSLNHCQLKKGGKVRGCLPLLYVWILGHTHGKRFQSDRHDPYSNPLMLFKNREGNLKLDKNGWIHLFSELKEDDILWKLPWWWEDEMIFCCGDFPNVPLMGPRGCVSCNPALALRQLAFTQGVPSEEVMQTIDFSHNDQEMIPLSKRIKEAWKTVVYKGKPALGKRTVNASHEYQTWLKGRMMGNCPSFAPYNPLLGNKVEEINKEMEKQLVEKRMKLEKLTEENRKDNEALIQMQNENANLYGEINRLKKRKEREESSEIMRLHEENQELRDTVARAQKQVKENNEAMRKHRARLIKVFKEKSQVEQQNLRYQEEIRSLTERLRNAQASMTRAREDAEDRILQLTESLNDSRTQAGNWKNQYEEQASETDLWRNRLGRVIDLVNYSIPEFNDAFRRAEGMANPLNTPFEILEFFNLCDEVVRELRGLAH